MSRDEDAPLAVFVAEFQEDLVSAFESFTGERPVLEPSWLDTAGKDAISIRLAQEKGEPGVVALRAKGKAIIGVAIEYRCVWNSTNQFLAVDQSSVKVIPLADSGREPLFRVEYKRAQDSHYPSSHFHVHAHRDEFTHLRGFAAKLDVERADKVEEYFTKPAWLSAFHFPTGGHRFRPCLEDILECLRVEFKLDVDNNRWQPHLRKARLKWRRIQTASVVQDDPEEALRVLVDVFGMPEPEGWVCPQGDPKKLARN